MNMNSELKKYCRLCATIQTPLIPIFEGSKRKVLYNRKLPDKINLCLPISVAKNDGLPQKICLACWKNLINCNNFAESSLNADATLNQLKNQLNNEINEISSKTCQDINNVVESDDPPDSSDTSFLHSTPDDCNQSLVGQNTGTISRKRASGALEKESQSKDAPQVQQVQQVSPEPEHCGSLLGEPVPATGNSAVAVIVAEKSANSKVILKIVLVPKDDSPVPVAERVASALQLEKRKKKRELQGSKKSSKLKSAPELSFACFDCKVTFLSRAALVLHFRNIHPTQVMECDKCGETVCGTQEVIERHQALHHTPEEDQSSDLLSTMTSEVKVTVKAFEKTASAVTVVSLGEYEPGLTKQLAYNQRQKILTKASSHPSIKRETKPQVMAALRRFLSKDQPYSVSQHLGVKPPPTTDSCIICFQSCANKEELNKHLVRFHRPRVLPTQCSHCEKVVAPYAMMFHLNKFHAPGGHLLCSVCDMEYTKTGKPQPHMILSPKLPCKFPECNEFFQSEQLLNSHVYSVHKVGAYSCEMCPKKFKTRATLANHIEWVHLNNGLAICEICGKALKSPKCLENHIKYMHTKQEDCICDVCGKVIPKQKMRIHMYRQHIRKANKRECEYCHTVLGLKTWTRHKNCKEKFGLDCSVRAEYSTFKANKSSKYECKFCHKLLSKPSWKYHQIFHEKHGADVVPKPGIGGFHVSVPRSEKNKKSMLYQCQYCHKFLGKKAWKYHQIFHEEIGADVVPAPGKRIIPHTEDPEVKLKFEAAERALKARTGKDKEKSWTKIVACEICNKEVRKYYLRLHMRLHSFTERNFSCDLCPKSFICKRSLHSHMIEVHLKTDGYSCQYCNKYFRKRMAVLAHEALHRNERHFHCPHCSKSFPGPGNLYGHIRLVHNPNRDIAPRRNRQKSQVTQDVQYVVKDDIEAEGSCFVTPIIIEINSDNGDESMNKKPRLQ